MEHLSKLNSRQIQAVSILEGPVLVIAAAGTGKTRVVTTRIIHMIQHGISPHQILGLTFTNKAASEMKERVEKMTQCHVLISTFHSLGARILRESIGKLGYSSNFTIYDEEDASKLLGSILEQMGIKLKKGEIKGWRSAVSKTKNDLVENFDLPAFPQVYQKYCEELKNCNAVDFDDLLYLPVKLFQDHPEILENYQRRWTHLLIDEYQDTNEAQYSFVKLLAGETPNLFVVGDPDQAIYSWRGANIRNILQFEKDFTGAQVIRLEQNYRSRSTILQAANALIQHNERRYEKELWSDRGEGEKIGYYTAYNDREEAQFIASRVRFHQRHGISLNEMAVFYRTNAQSRTLEDRFLSLGIPYVIVGGLSFYQRREIKDILAYLRLLVSDHDMIAFSRALNIPKRGIGDVTLGKIITLSQMEATPILETCRSVVAGKTFSAKIRQGLEDFLKNIDALREMATNAPIEKIIKETIFETDYLTYLKEEPETLDDRKENLNELIAKGIEWDLAHQNSSLSEFLEELSLKSNFDDIPNLNERVSLMTLHNGKGLEFEVAFIAGLEEDLLPHINSKDSPDLIEEERRLCYVGITRAKEFLYLTHAQIRYLWGAERFQRPSRFLKEIPSEYLSSQR